MFKLDRFIEDCRAAVAVDPSHRLVREEVLRAVADPSGILAELGEPKEAGIQLLHRSPELTVLNFVWGPWMTLMPHNHHLWAVIGIYGGGEDNVFWRRIETEHGPRIEAAGAKALRTGDAGAMGKDIIHSVTNPTCKLTGALHVYGGDFFRDDRSAWDPETLTEHAYDVEVVKEIFAEANGRIARQ